MLGFLFWPLTLLKWLIFSLLGLLVALTCALTVTGFWGEEGWGWDLTSHFRLVYLAVQLLALLVLGLPAILYRRKTGGLPRLMLALISVFAALNLSQILPYYWPQPSGNNLLPGRIRLLHANVLYANHNAGILADYIREKDPDILTLAKPLGGGLPLGAVLLREDLAEPHGLDLWIGLPASEDDRVAGRASPRAASTLAN